MSYKFLILLYIIQTIFTSKQNQKSKKNLRIIEENDELSDDIVLIHLNDVHCGLSDKIGYDGFVLYQRELQKKYKNVLLVDVGDHIQGGSIGAISDGEAIIKIMNKINFDVVTLGNHEFDYGVEQLLKLGKNITSNYICSNFCYKKNKTSIFPPYKIIKVGNKSIGFIGVLTPLTFSKTYLSSLKDDNGDYLYDFLVNDGVQELYDTIQKYIDELRNEQKVDYVILLTHIGMYREIYKTNDLLSNISGVDAILDGHTHLIYNVTSKDKKNNEIYISQTGTKFENIGKLIIKTDGSFNAEIISEVPKPDDDINGAINVTRSNKNRWVDENMTNFIKNVTSEYDDELDAVIGYSDYELLMRTENITSSNYLICRYRECTLGNLISDAVQNAGKGDFAMINGGTVKNNLNKGNITKRNTIDIIPYFNDIVIKELPGQIILDALEFAVSNYPISSGFLQVSSELSFTFDSSINSTVVKDSTGLFKNITGERRIVNAKIKGEDIDPNKNYSVVLSEYVARGGSGFTMFSDYEITREALITDTHAFADFIENDLQGIIPENYSKYQGRIKILNQTDINDSTDVTDTDSNSTETDSDEIFEYFKMNIKNNKKGLSAGGIVGIVIPCVVLLAIVAALIFMKK